MTIGTSRFEVDRRGLPASARVRRERQPRQSPCCRNTSRNSVACCTWENELGMDWNRVSVWESRYDIPHHPLAHDVMMGVTDAQGLTIC